MLMTLLISLMKFVICLNTRVILWGLCKFSSSVFMMVSKGADDKINFSIKCFQIHNKTTNYALSSTSLALKTRCTYLVTEGGKLVSSGCCITVILLCSTFRRSCQTYQIHRFRYRKFVTDLVSFRWNTNNLANPLLSCTQTANKTNRKGSKVKEKVRNKTAKTFTCSTGFEGKETRLNLLRTTAAAREEH